MCPARKVGRKPDDGASSRGKNLPPSRVRLFGPLLALLFSATAGLAGLPVKVAVIAFGPSDSSGLVAKEIARLEGVEVVHERLESKTSDVLTNEERKALGVVFRSELLLLVSPKGDAFAYVDASTGEELFRIRDESAEALVHSAFALVEELRDAEKALPEPSK